MAWTAGVTRTTGDLITAANWNSYLGAAGSLDYLKDAIESCSVSSPTRALATIYQNGSKIRVVAIVTSCGDGEGVYVEIGSASPPTTDVGRWTHSGVTNIRIPSTFLVPPSWYYRMTIYTGTPTILYSTEYDLL